MRKPTDVKVQGNWKYAVPHPEFTDSVAKDSGKQKFIAEIAMVQTVIRLKVWTFSLGGKIELDEYFVSWERDAEQKAILITPLFPQNIQKGYKNVSSCLKHRQVYYRTDHRINNAQSKLR